MLYRDNGKEKVNSGSIGVMLEYILGIILGL